MNQLTLKFKQWFSSLTDSEQRLLKIASVLLTLTVGYYSLVSLSSYTKQAKIDLDNQVALNIWATEQIEKINNASVSNATKDYQYSITQAVNVSAKQNKIAISRIQPQADDLVRVGIDDVDFEILMKWLQVLSNEHGVSVVNIDVTSAQPGVVKIRRLDVGR